MIGSLATAANAAVTFSGTNGSNLSASAQFSIVGGNLQILLTNTSASDTLVPANLLTGLFFTVSDPQVALSRTGGSALLNGSTVSVGGATLAAGNPLVGGGDVGGEFAFRSGLTGGIFGAGTYYGVSSSGLGIFGPGDRFTTTNLHGPDSPNGMNYGIVSAGDSLATYNGGMADEPLISNSVLITLTGTQFLDLNEIGNVMFQYGTGTDEPRLTGGTPTTTSTIPETSSTLALGGLMLSGAFMRVRRKRS